MGSKSKRALQSTPTPTDKSNSSGVAKKPKASRPKVPARREREKSSKSSEIIDLSRSDSEVLSGSILEDTEGRSGANESTETSGLEKSKSTKLTASNLRSSSSPARNTRSSGVPVLKAQSPLSSSSNPVVSAKSPSSRPDPVVLRSKSPLSSNSGRASVTKSKTRSSSDERNAAAVLARKNSSASTPNGRVLRSKLGTDTTPSSPVLRSRSPVSSSTHNTAVLRTKLPSSSGGTGDDPNLRAKSSSSSTVTDNDSGLKTTSPPIADDGPVVQTKVPSPSEACTAEACTVETCTVETCTVEACTVKACTVEACTVEACTVEASTVKCEDRKSQAAKEAPNTPSVKAVKSDLPAFVNSRVTLSYKFIGEPFSGEEARRRWPHRYPTESARETSLKKSNRTSDLKSECLAHYSRAEVDHHVYELGDCVFVNSLSTSDYLGKILELYELADHTLWFRVQWFYRIGDTSIGKDTFEGHDPKRVFFSESVDDNLLECLVEKKQVSHVPVPPRFKSPKYKRVIPGCDFYFDMGYEADYSRFYELPEDLTSEGSGDLSAESSEEATSAVAAPNLSDAKLKGKSEEGETPKHAGAAREELERGPEICLLDLYSGCGGMSTGLCMGARLNEANLVTKWAVDLSEPACMSLKHNHPDTEVRCESADDFYSLITEWDRLCQEYEDSKETASDDETDDDDHKNGDGGEYEVEKLVGIRWSGASKISLTIKKRKSPMYTEEANDVASVGLEYKVRWKGYKEEEDTWEPVGHLEGSKKLIKEFVLNGKAKKILPRPGECDVICGGPPCQGISGFNRFRNTLQPLECVRNRQVITYMDIVEFLRPRFVLMENVVDILKFADGYLGRYAMSRLVQMHYQAKLGLMVAGCYGLPQFRMRVFLWGAAPGESLPLFPLPTHFVVTRGFAPQNFERNVVAYDESETPRLKNALVLEDAISDLPEIGNNDRHDEMTYTREAATKFQELIRLPPEAYKLRATAAATTTKSDEKAAPPILYDHRSLELNEDDFQRAQRIPKLKGANFRDLEIRGEKEYLPSGKPLVPNYAITFVQGRSNKPFGRLWWDETVATVVTRAEPHNQCVLHPVQDRVLSIRENARLQGFPDWYKLFGTVKERYIQVGNAVAVPVARALGYALGSCLRKTQHQDSDEADDPCCAKYKENGLMELPAGFPLSLM